MNAVKTGRYAKDTIRLAGEDPAALRNRARQSSPGWCSKNMAVCFPLWVRREAGIVKAVIDWS
jgi:hypothetical protein